MWVQSAWCLAALCRGVPQRTKHNSPFIKPSIIVLDPSLGILLLWGGKWKERLLWQDSRSSSRPLVLCLLLLRSYLFYDHLISHNQSSNSGSCNATLFFLPCLEYNGQWFHPKYSVSPMMAPANAGDAGSILGLGRSPGGGHGNQLQYSCLENAMDRRAWLQSIGSHRFGHNWAINTLPPVVM